MISFFGVMCAKYGKYIKFTIFRYEQKDSMTCFVHDQTMDIGFYTCQ